MPRDDEDDHDYTTHDVGPREPDRFEKRGNPDSERANDQRRNEDRDAKQR